MDRSAASRASFRARTAAAASSSRGLSDDASPVTKLRPHPGAKHSVIPGRSLTISSSPAARASRHTNGVFSRQSDGTTVAAQYAKHGITLRPANTDRLNGWAEIMSRFGEVSATPGDPANIRPTLFIHQRCGRLIETLPALQHDPNRPEDVLKVDADEEGVGGDDAADALRYLVATKGREVRVRKLRGM